MAKNWGYDPLIFGAGEFNEMYILPYKLTVRNAESNELITTINACYTIDEIKKELERVACKGNVHIYKNFKAKLEFENRGKTDANNLDIKIKAKHDNLEWQDAFTTNTKIILAADQITTTMFEFDFPINSKLPEELHFKILLNFDNIHDNNIDKEINAKWTSNDNFWSYNNK